MHKPQKDRRESSDDPQHLLREVLAGFDRYASVCASRDSVFKGSRSTREQEQRAFDELRQIMDRVRQRSGP
ncbi:hypothetical protein ABT127_37420 [Streptomyces sp. NPDC001904]|uniref:hypothetical protein n=1 Tax=Streptomyces sp. NPDC001904 TaxID=3154531 RepID=UPI00332D24FA